MSETSTALVAPADLRPMPTPDAKTVKMAYAAILDGTKPPEIGDPEITNRAILEEIANADTFEAVFQAQSLPAWQEYALDKPVTVGGFHLNPSSFEGGSSVYAVVELLEPDDVGEVKLVRVTVGGQKVLVQLLKAWEKGWFPIRVQLSSKQTRTEGREVLGLEPVS